MSPWMEEELKPVVIENNLTPAQVPAKLQEAQRKATYNWMTRLWHWVKGHTAEDIERLKEAGLRKLESDNELKEAQALKTYGEAAEAFMRVEAIRQEVSIMSAMSEEENSSYIDYDEIKAAQKRIKDAVTKLRMKGGRLLVNKDDLKNHVEQGMIEFPDDKDIDVQNDSLDDK